MLTMDGQLQGKRASSYQGQSKVYLQFLQKNLDGSLGFTEVKVPEGVDHEQFKVGQNIRVPVDYKVVREKVYWTIAREAPASGTAKAA